jgi:hypothetical protein
MARAGLEQVLAWGTDYLQAELGARTRYVLEQVASYGYRAAPADQQAPHLVGMRAAPERFSVAFRDRLSRNHIHVSFRGDCLRLSPHLHTGQQHLDQFVSLLTQSSYVYLK